MLPILVGALLLAAVALIVLPEQRGICCSTATLLRIWASRAALWTRDIPVWRSLAACGCHCRIC